MRLRLLTGLVALALVAPVTAEASSIDMGQVRSMAKKSARKMMVLYDASDYRVVCFRKSSTTATCRLRMVDATDSDGMNYDCSIWTKYRLKGRYIYQRMAANYC